MTNNKKNYSADIAGSDLKVYFSIEEDVLNNLSHNSVILVSHILKNGKLAPAYQMRLACLCNIKKLT